MPFSTALLPILHADPLVGLQCPFWGTTQGVNDPNLGQVGELMKSMGARFAEPGIEVLETPWALG